MPNPDDFPTTRDLGYSKVPNALTKYASANQLIAGVRRQEQDLGDAAHLQPANAADATKVKVIGRVPEVPADDNPAMEFEF